MKKHLTILIPFLALAAVAGALLLPRQAGAETGIAGIEVVMFKSPSCGCCGDYVAVLRNAGARVSIVDTDDMATVKNDKGVPPAAWSCHTMEVDDYTVEGHVPVPALERLLAERPKVTGVALPGMPAGSPGMTGTKLAPFEVLTFDPQGLEQFGEF